MILPNYFNAKKSLHLFGLFNNFNFFKNLYIEKKLPKVLMLSGKKGNGKSTLLNHLMYFIFDNDNYDEKINKLKKQLKLLNFICNINLVFFFRTRKINFFN